MNVQTEERWLRTQLDLDAPPVDLELDGRTVLAAGRRRRRRQRLAGGVPLVAVLAAVGGTGLWAADLLPDPVQRVLPAAPGPASDCLRLEPGTGDAAGEGAGATTEVLSDPAPLALTTWTEQDGTTVWVVPAGAGCSPGGAPDAVPLAYVRQVPGEPPVLEGYRDAREDVTVWGGTVLGGAEGSDALAIVPGPTSELHVVGGGEVGDLVAVTDEAGATVAQVARVSDAGPHGRDVTALLWRAEGDSSFTTSWLHDDLLAAPGSGDAWSQPEGAGPGDPDAGPDWELGPPPEVGARAPQLVRGEADGRWWLWIGTDEVAGPLDVPDGPWAFRLVGEDVSALVGWLPDGTTELLVDGQRASVLPLTTLVGDDLPGLDPFVVDPYRHVEEAVAVDEDGTETPLRLVDVDLEQPRW